MQILVPAREHAALVEVINRETVSTAEDTSTTGSEPETKQLTALASDADPGDTDPGAADAVEMPSTAEKANPVPKVESPQPDTAALEKPSSPVTPSEDVVPASMARMGARTPTDPRSLNQARFEFPSANEASRKLRRELKMKQKQ